MNGQEYLSVLFDRDGGVLLQCWEAEQKTSLLSFAASPTSTVSSAAFSLRTFGVDEQTTSTGRLSSTGSLGSAAPVSSPYCFQSVASEAALLYQQARKHDLGFLKLCFAVAMARAEKAAAERVLQTAEAEVKPRGDKMMQLIVELEALDPKLAEAEGEQKVALAAQLAELERKAEEGQVEYQKLEGTKEVVRMQVVALEERVQRLEGEMAASFQAANDLSPTTPHYEELQYLQVCERKKQLETQLEQAQKALAPKMEETKRDLEQLEQHEIDLARFEADGAGSDEINELTKEISLLDQRLMDKAYSVQKAEARVEVAMAETEKLGARIAELEQCIKRTDWRRSRTPVSSRLPMSSRLRNNSEVWFPSPIHSPGNQFTTSPSARVTAGQPVRYFPPGR
mmetsp:Transcript_11979/g.27633  ORF Transcript_11979/g.27633 Transcript_11979/m.27633 type:complete len:397 (-) Transcript_11979:408-1598(-)